MIVEPKVEKWVIVTKQQESSFKPRLIISYEMHELIKKIHTDDTWKNKERSALAKVSPWVGEQEWCFVLSDMIFPEQRNSGGNTQFTAEWYSKMYDTVLDKDPANTQDWCCWLHSHNQMQVFRSAQDYETKSSFNRRVVDGEWKWMIDRFFSIVTSTGWWSDYHQDGVYYRGSIDIYSPVRLEFDLEIGIEANEAIEELLNRYEEVYKHIDEDPKYQRRISLIEEVYNGMINDSIGSATNKDSVNTIMEMLLASEHNKSAIIGDIKAQNRFYIEAAESFKNDAIAAVEDEKDKEFEALKEKRGDEISAIDSFDYDGYIASLKSAELYVLPQHNKQWKIWYDVWDSWTPGKKKERSVRRIKNVEDDNFGVYPTHSSYVEDEDGARDLEEYASADENNDADINNILYNWLTYRDKNDMIIWISSLVRNTVSKEIYVVKRLFRGEDRAEVAIAWADAYSPNLLMRVSDLERVVY